MITPAENPESTQTSLSARCRQIYWQENGMNCADIWLSQLTMSNCIASGTIDRLNAPLYTIIMNFSTPIFCAIDRIQAFWRKWVVQPELARAA